MTRLLKLILGCCVLLAAGIVGGAGTDAVFQRTGSDGVIEEQLVEIPHPEEQETAGVRLFDLVILDHHRRGGRHGGNGIGAGMIVHRRAEHRGETGLGV